MTGNGHNTQEELASYAMQGLPVEESASIRAHLQSCADCRAELAALCGDLALLGSAVPQEPLPEGARQRFLEKIASTVEVKTPANHTPANHTPANMAEVTAIHGNTAKRGAGYWIPWAATAALAIATISLGVQNRALKDEQQDQLSMITNLAARASRAQQVLEVLTAPGAQRVTLTEGKLPVQPSARATYFPERGGLVLQATNLKPLPEGKTYELWIIPANGTAPVPAGMFRPDTAGSATLVLPPLPSGVAAKAFGVTIENAAGATTPTIPIVLSGAPS